MTKRPQHARQRPGVPVAVVVLVGLASLALILVGLWRYLDNTALAEQQAQYDGTAQEIVVAEAGQTDALVDHEFTDDVGLLWQMTGAPLVQDDGSVVATYAASPEPHPGGFFDWLTDLSSDPWFFGQAAIALGAIGILATAGLTDRVISERRR